MDLGRFAGWGDGDWRQDAAERPVHRDNFIQWYRDRPVSLRPLLLRFPLGCVVQVMPGGQLGCVTGYVEPIAVPPEGALMLWAGPQPGERDALARRAGVEVEEWEARPGLAAVVAYRHGFDRAAVEHFFALAGIPVPELPRG